MEKKADLKERLERINKYSNNSIVRKLSTEEQIRFELFKIIQI